MFTTDETVPWERQRGEPAKAYHAFCHARDLVGGRSIAKAFQAHRAQCLGHPGGPKAAPGSWKRWSVRWDWVARCDAYDRDLDTRTRAKLAEQVVAARERHARIVQGAITVLSAPVRAVLEALADPQVLQRLRTQATGDKFLVVLQAARDSIRVLPALIESERLVLGMHTASLEIHDSSGNALANRIVSDPTATQLAIELLDRLAGTGEGSAPPSPNLAAGDRRYTP